MDSREVVKLKQEYKRCKLDPIYFISNYIKVVHPVRGLVPFKLYPFQKMIMECLENNRFNILRKFRQAGCTTISAAYALWMAIFQEHKTIVFLSVGDTESTEILDRIKIMFDELPQFLKPRILQENMHNLKLSTGSVIKSRPSGKQSGRSLAGSFLFIDEAAFIEHIDSIWAAVYPIISTGGRAFVLSTVNGVGNWYYDTWLNAIEGANSFNPIQINWQDHPEYNRIGGYDNLYEDMEKLEPPIFIDKWEDTTRSNMSHRKWLQEYECEFLGTGETYIEGTILSNMYKRVKKPLYRTFNNRMHIWEDPRPSRQYLIGVDVSLGRERDYSAFHVFDTYSGEQVAEYYSNTTPINELAEVLNQIGQRYNLAVIFIERNSIGHNLVDHLFERLEYENLYFDEKRNIGIQVTTKNRDSMLAMMEECLRLNKIKINSKRTVAELNTFIVSFAGKAQAERSKHDDLVTSLALCAFGMTTYLESIPVNFIDQNGKTPTERLLAPVRLRNLKSYGDDVEEDISWLMK
jgi:hypothetical protein